MNWNETKQSRFDELRMRELAGTITPAEQTELSQLINMLETEEVELLAPALQKTQDRQHELQEKLDQKQREAEQLTRLLQQQEQLISDARRWIKEFETRHSQIQQTYDELLGEARTPV
jgi:hypothetical protein